MEIFKKRRLSKQLKAALHHARTLRLSREDIMPAADLKLLDSQMARTQAARQAGEIKGMEDALVELGETLKELVPVRKMAFLADNFDVAVVAIGVAMAFRAYFYQPFKIPTGSMMPTLYGIHSVAQPAESATWLDRQPLKFCKWLLTGKSFKVIRATTIGELQITGDTNTKPGYMRVNVGGYSHFVPSDAVVRQADSGLPMLSGSGLRQGERVRSGQVIWSGAVISGDFVFVNRWLWNFRHPRRGEVMVFATNGINPKALQQGTHYIKRMTGLPHDRLRVRPPELLINGQVIREPERIAQITDKILLPGATMAYSGFNPAPGADARFQHPGTTLTQESDEVILGADQYYAMGDNSFNSFDSRYWGPVPERNLLGPATLVYWPFTSPRFGSIR